MNWYKNQETSMRVGIAAAVVAAIGTIIAALIGGGFQILSSVIQGGGDQGPQSGSQPTTLPAPSTMSPVTTPPPTASEISPTTPVSCEENFKITSPLDFQEVFNSTGVLVKGEACTDTYIWLLDYDTFDGYFYQVNEKPIPVVNGRWAFLNEPIGDVADQAGTIYTIAALSVSQACNDALIAAKPNSDNTVRFKPLPPECPDVESGKDPKVRQVQVIKNGP